MCLSHRLVYRPQQGVPRGTPPTYHVLKFVYTFKCLMPSSLLLLRDLRSMNMPARWRNSLADQQACESTSQSSPRQCAAITLRSLMVQTRVHLHLKHVVFRSILSYCVELCSRVARLRSIQQPWTLTSCCPKRSCADKPNGRRVDPARLAKIRAMHQEENGRVKCRV